MKLGDITAELEALETRRLELIELRKAWHSSRKLPCKACGKRSSAKTWTRVYHLHYEESGHNGDWRHSQRRYIECPQCNSSSEITGDPRGWGFGDINDESFVITKNMYETSRGMVEKL